MGEMDPDGIEPRSLLAAAEFRGRRVLEIGCGDGRLTFRYGAVPSMIIGFEPHSELLQIASAACPPELKGHIGFIQATAMSLPFGSSVFDIALLAKSL
jgi:ubiquinone/menaquinone biosynthesis C-methylase UbiE